MARAQGLIVRPDVARRIAESCGGNRALIGQELAKFALYAGAAPETPKAIDHDVIDALGAGSDEGDLSRLVDSVAGGDSAGLAGRAGAAPCRGAGGHHPDPRDAPADDAARPAARRGRAAAATSLQSWRHRASPCSGKRKTRSAASLSRWRSDLLAKAMSRLLEAERQVKALGRDRPARGRRGIVRDLPAGGAARGRPRPEDSQNFSPLSRWQIMSSWSRVE